MSLTEEEKQKIYEEEKAKMGGETATTAATDQKAVDGNIQSGNIVSLLGGIMLAIGIFLPWVTMGMLSADGTTKLGEQAYFYLGIGLVSALLSLMGISQKKSQSVINAVCGIAAIGLLIWHYTVLHEHVQGINIMGRTPDIAIGFWVTCIGAIMILLGASIAGRKKK